MAEAAADLLTPPATPPATAAVAAAADDEDDGGSGSGVAGAGVAAGRGGAADLIGTLTGVRVAAAAAALVLGVGWVGARKVLWEVCGGGGCADAAAVNDAPAVNDAASFSALPACMHGMAKPA